MSASKIEIGTITTVAIAIIGGALWLGNMQGTLSSLKSDKIQAERDKAVSSIQKAIEDASGDLKDITKILPVGSIIPSMLPPDKFYSLSSGKWKIADGSKIDNKSRYVEIVGSLRVPDLQNMFLRGASNDRAAGSFEGDSTKLPNNGFTGETTSNGAHTHPKGANHSGDQIKAGPYANMSTATTIPSSGGHNHDLRVMSGGDPETRPKNIAVHFYIKIDS